MQWAVTVKVIDLSLVYLFSENHECKCWPRAVFKWAVPPHTQNYGATVSAPSLKGDKDPNAAPASPAPHDTPCAQADLPSPRSPGRLPDREAHPSSAFRAASHHPLLHTLALSGPLSGCCRHWRKARPPYPTSSSFWRRAFPTNKHSRAVRPHQRPRELHARTLQTKAGVNPWAPPR